MIRKPTDIRQDEIKSAVLNIIFRDGLKKISTKNIAKEVGISEGSIFRHFTSKKAIILGIMNDVITDMIEELRMIAFQDISPEKRLYQYLCKTVSYLVENKGITMLLFSEASYQNDEDLMSKLNYILTSQKQLVSKIVSDGLALGVWDNTISAEDFATLYMGIPITLNIEMIFSKHGVEVNNFCSRMYDMIIRILEK